MKYKLGDEVSVRMNNKTYIGKIVYIHLGELCGVELNVHIDGYTNNLNGRIRKSTGRWFYEKEMKIAKEEITGFIEVSDAI